MVNTPIDGKQDFDDLIDQSSTLSYDLRKSVEFIVEELRLKSQLTRSKIQQLLGAHISDRLYTRGPTTLFRNREKDEDVTEDIVAGAIAAQRSSYADVLSLDAAYDGKTIETRLRNVPTGSLLESPTSKQAKDVVKVYNFLRSASIGYSADIPNAAEWLTNDADYSRILALQKIADSKHERFTGLGEPVKDYEIFTLYTPGGGASGTDFKVAYQKLVDAIDAKDTAQSTISGAERDTEVAKEELIQVQQDLTTTRQTIANLQRAQMVRSLNAAQQKDLDDAVAVLPTIQGDIARLRGDLTAKQAALRTLIATRRVADKEREIESIRAQITDLTTEYEALKVDQSDIIKSLPGLGFTPSSATTPVTVADALTQNVTLSIDRVSETHTLQEWIDSGRLLQFADRIQSMKIKSSRGRLSADQFLKEATMYHLFGQYKKLDEHEEQELRETMAKFVYTKPEEPPVEPTPHWINRGANSAYTGTARRLQYVGSLPGTLAGSVKKGLKTIWKNL